MAWGQVTTNEGLSWIRGAGGGNSDPVGIEDREENRISQNPIVELPIEATAMGGGWLRAEIPLVSRRRRKIWWSEESDVEGYMGMGLQKGWGR
jgi:hypothetical protein